MDEVLLNELVKARFQALALDRIRLDVNAAGFALLACLLVVFPRIVVDAGILFDGLRHRHARPWAFHVDFLALILDLQRAADLLGHIDIHLFDEIHDLMIIRIRLIQLDRGEFRVVAGIHLGVQAI